MPAWLTYSVLRLILVVIPLVVFLALGVYWLISVAAAVLVGLLLSYVLLRGPRERMSRQIAEYRDSGERASESLDDDEEDAVADSWSTSGRSASTAPESGRPGTERPEQEHPDQDRPRPERPRD